MKSMDLPKDLPGNPWIYPQKCGSQMRKDLRYHLDVIMESSKMPLQISTYH